MEILLFRCLFPECDHVESDTSPEAAKRRVRVHMRDVHHALFVQYPPPGLTPEQIDAMIAQGVQWDGAWAGDPQEAASG